MLVGVKPCSSAAILLVAGPYRCRFFLSLQSLALQSSFDVNVAERHFHPDMWGSKGTVGYCFAIRPRYAVVSSTMDSICRMVAQRCSVGAACEMARLGDDNCFHP